VIQSIAVLTPLYVTGFWAIVFLSSSKKKNRAKFFLGFFMLIAFSLYMGHSLFFLANFDVYIHYDPVYITTSLLVYPMYYQYTRLLTVDSVFNSRYFFHYIPAFVMGILTVILHSVSHHQGNGHLEEYFRQSYQLNFDRSSGLFWNSLVYFFHRLVFAVQIILYFWKGYSLIKKHRERLLNYYSNQERRGIKWVSNIFISLVIVAILSSAFNIIGKFMFLNHPHILLIPSFLFSSMIFILGFLANGQDQIVREIELADSKESEFMVSNVRKEDDMELRLDELFRIEKIFLNPDLKIWDVSARLGTNRTYLSNYINKKYSVNFSRYVNRFRVDEAKNLMSSPDNRIYSLEVIGEKCGFGSYNNFIRVFREFENMTPSSFRDNPTAN
jgi:AraC-like DNA-binding protein